MERHLAIDKHVDVYGIYFDFASDRVRLESTPVLAEIAGVLAKNDTDEGRAHNRRVELTRQ
jgi:outer membrane protein OmpA-like peptidoglycan-associated protein